MKRLNLIDDSRRVKSIQEIQAFSDEYALDFPSHFAEFLFSYEGSSVKEYVYFCEKENSWSAINQILFLRKNEVGLSLEDCLGFILQNGKIWLPFANDPGGWLFLLSRRENSENQVWVYTTNGEMLFVSDSFVAFINGLMSYEEASAKGY